MGLLRSGWIVFGEEVGGHAGQDGLLVADGHFQMVVGVDSGEVGVSPCFNVSSTNLE